MPFLGSFSNGCQVPVTDGLENNLFQLRYQVPVTEGIENEGGSVTVFKVSVTESPRK